MASAAAHPRMVWSTKVGVPLISMIVVASA
jgi:hypothetical protein